jgi:SAM-dependent MidA family methyltransferase
VAEPGELEVRIRAEIRRSGPMTFVRFMHRALYEPGLGYYDRLQSRIGRGGDFVTSPTLTPAYGRTLARLVPRLRAATGTTGPFRVVDVGAGEGGLLAALAPAAGGEIEAVVVEPGDELRRRAAERVAASGVPVVALAAAAALAGLEPRPGLVVANEVFDALPARRLRREERGLEEAHVALAGDSLAEVWLEAEAEASLADLPPGRECCVTPGIRPLLADLGAGIERGLVLIVDYGHPRAVIRGSDGCGNPIRGFRGGTLAKSPIERPGEVDLTAHVDFSAIRDAAIAIGLEPIFFTDQTYLLLALGFLDDPAAPSARRLIHPEDMGGAFRCLALGKGIDPERIGDLPLRSRLGHLAV